MTELLSIESLNYWFKVWAFLWLGGGLGMTFADLDLAPPLPFHHRSAWTHGPWIPFGLGLMIAPNYGMARWFVLGFLATYAMHLCYDMFPKQWTSIARISWYPLRWRMPGSLSFWYLFLGAMSAYLTIFWLVSSPVHVLVILFITGFVVWRYNKHEKPPWPKVLSKFKLVKTIRNFPVFMMAILAFFGAVLIFTQGLL